MIDKNTEDHFLLAEDAMSRNDYKLAAKEYKIASERGNFDAKISLAVLYATGSGLDCNGAAAVSLLEEVICSSGANPQQIALALHNMSTLYITGSKFLQPDKERAKNYEAQAKALGFPAR